MTKIIDTNACEFGYEMIMVVPYVYYLHLNKIDFKLITCQKMEPFYYFLQEKNVEFKYKKRTHRYHPSGVIMKNIHVPNLSNNFWSPPPYYEIYKSKKTNLIKEKYIYISNKYTIEWGRQPINFLSLEFLKKILQEFSDIKIVYNRPRSGQMVEDDQEILGFKDYQELQHFKNFIDIKTLQDNSNLSFNELQLELIANASFTLSVQGGNSILCSFCNKKNIIFAKQGKEFKNNPMSSGSSFLWYNKFCKGSEVYASNLEDDIIKKMKEWQN